VIDSTIDGALGGNCDEYDKICIGIVDVYKEAHPQAELRVAYLCTEATSHTMMKQSS
jgi:hypothetical protein